MKIGDKVKINDYSEAHGKIGKIYFIYTNGVILTQLKECIWINSKDELIYVPEK